MQDKNKKLALTGGGAGAEALRQINPDVMPVYPITPQTPILVSFAKYQAKKKVDTELITVESEHSAMSAAIGSAAAGARTVTATSSQGLALMNEMLYIASGMQLPILMLVSARALSAPLNIHGDHSDVMGARDAGWVQIFSENNQEVYDNTLIGMKIAEKSKMPVMVVMDGFVTSHTVMNLETLPDEKVKKFLGEYVAENSLLDAKNPVSYGTLALPEHYFEFKIEQDKALRMVHDHYRKVSFEFEKLTGRFHDFFESYRAEDAESVVVLMGSATGTAKEAVDKLRKKGKKVGLIKIKLFRPFLHGEIAAILNSAKKVAVLDRSMSFGTFPPLYSEIMNACCIFGSGCEVASYIYGLGGRDIFQSDIEKVFKDLAKGRGIGKINYLGTK